MSEELPEPPITFTGVKRAVAPAGSPLTLRATVPVNPFSEMTLAVYEALWPGSTELTMGVTEPVKSAVELISNSRLPPCERLPLVPVIVRMYAPDWLVVGDTTVRIELPEPPVTTGGLKLTKEPGGIPDTLSVTSPVNPLKETTCTA